MKKILFILFIIFTINNFSQDTRDIKFELLNFSDKKYNDFAPTLYKDGIIFTSDRNSNNKIMELYYSNLKTSPIKIIVKNNQYNLGPAFYDKKNNKLYFTKINNMHFNYRYKFAIHEGKLNNDELLYHKMLSFCKPKYNYGHSTIFNDKLLISYSNNRSFFLVLYKYKNKWIKDKVIFKSNHNMLFPNYLNENTIIFSTKRKGGLGGLDLYKIIKKNKKWSKPINLKEFNTKYDDFGLLYINEYEGYISSNRIDNKDHIFKFTIKH